MQITKEQLKEKYKTMKTNELAKELGISVPTLTATLKRCGIKLKGKGNKKPKQKLVIVE